jgi:hypothetical protein
MDTGCSFAMTFDERDFVEIVHATFGQVQTAGAQLPITAFGIVEWKIAGSEGLPLSLRIPCHLVSGSNVCLLSPQYYVRYHKLPATSGQFGGTANGFWMNLQGGGQIHCNVDPRSNIPTALALALECTVDCSCSEAHVAFNNNVILDDENQNLSSAQNILC